MSKLTDFDDYMASLPADRRKRIDDRSKVLVQSIELSKLRKSKALNQTQLAKLMNVTQASISKVESGKDIQISTLQKYVRSLGGEVVITARMPNGEVQLM
ncbi:helix-turn-helix domain-containing protein [Psychrobacter sp. NPDC078761]|jgi:DNA-binding XRE family transcriptional regulator|uniref:helix-turn-helix domain-containing protein n=1 Tax=Psychrobacter sp. NPDC078761 TaxID=3390668 RepID=UPI003CFD9867|tara:strand:+ start:1558 stop:1857 length:300 start_codon:yes stop_codon:yes gene_type:complete